MNKTYSVVRVDFGTSFGLEVAKTDDLGKAVQVALGLSFMQWNESHFQLNEREELVAQAKNALTKTDSRPERRREVLDLVGKAFTSAKLPKYVVSCPDGV